ncbi:helix-turn-helix transcriptional regulator [Spiractinospora alimapuensis]|uniref:ArsR/SmtB family transcription factor n=1 Tax=Spiractinospora alimapuensis TaxID=2820884 RepID=UPI001F4740C3|nr:helix-turn-helix domain-containing protein [Spiractinospora alimapuensis]QVQ50858.1 helix-turn-helix transcriptional regulator [Spiractinospora alimapuensis]
MTSDQSPDHLNGQAPTTADLNTLKALANPLRQRILRHLQERGPATSTTLAKDLGVTSGGTSYNLRILADSGLVEEVPERAHGRERWWRYRSADLRLPRGGDTETEAAVGELLGQWFEADAQDLERFAAAQASMGEWGDALQYSRGAITVTRAELENFFSDYLALLRRYQHAAASTDDARLVHTRLLALPSPDAPDAADARSDATGMDGEGHG